MNSLGRHILVEFIGCSPEVLDDVTVIEKSMIDAAQEAGATVINSTFHHFSPYGVSGVVVIQESHLAIHTWPEYQYAAVDLFTCGDGVDSWKSFDWLRKAFQAKNYSVLEMYRGSIALLQRVDYKPAMGRMAMQKILQPEFRRNLWFTDKDDNQAFSLRYTGNVLFREKSPFQNVRVFETLGYGKMLAIDNMVMCTERDEAHYHEMITHPALQTHGKAKNVLVIGGGDGGTIREVLRYPGVESVTMVEIDEAVVRASKEFLPSVSCQFNNPKLKLLIQDGIQFVKDAKEKTYDIVIVDGSDPVGPAEGLFSAAFYRECYRVLKDGGILSTQGESPMFHEKAFRDLKGCLKEIFGKDSAHTLLFYAPSYPTGMWSIQLAVKGNLHPAKDFDAGKANAFTKEHSLKYYNAELHAASFVLPNFIKKLLHE
jgi:spermidine synthase